MKSLKFLNTSRASDSVDNGKIQVSLLYSSKMDIDNSYIPVRKNCGKVPKDLHVSSTILLMFW